MQNIGGFSKPDAERKSLPAPTQDTSPDHSGAIAAFKGYGVEIARSKFDCFYRLWTLGPDDCRSAPQALGGAVAWSIRTQADAKAGATDRRLLSRMCELARESKSAHEAVWAVQRALPPLPPGASPLQRLTRVEVLREGGRAITREFPHLVTKVDTSLGQAIGHAGSPPEVAAMAHGISLELRHQGTVMPSGRYWWRDLGDGVNIPVQAGLQMTHRLSPSGDSTQDLRTMPLEQALLILSSLRYHTQARDRDIDEVAADIRKRPDITDEVDQTIDAMVPVAGAFAAYMLTLDVRYSRMTRERLVDRVTESLGELARRPSPHLFTTAADVFVQSHLYQRADRDSKESQTPGDDEITEADFLRVKDLSTFEAFVRAVEFYDSYHQLALAPLLAQARRTPRTADGTLPAFLRQRLERHGQLLRQELAALEQRPYLQAALRPFTGNKAAQLEALRARIRRPLSLVEAALRGPVG